MYSKATRKRIFEEEISELAAKELITDREKSALLEKYSRYYSEALIQEEKQRIEKANEAALKREQETIQLQKKLEELRKKKQKPTLTPDQIRERNITWMLVLGTILLLMGGLVLATNNWEKMTPLLKSLSIGFVAVLFYGLNYFTGKKLKIDKTAFAFLTLGSLFIPITILSAGYFELFGKWFSLSGEGRYLFLAIGLGITLPVYVKHAINQNANFYVWVSYITLSLSVAFLIASFYPSKDIFYIGVLLFNLVLLFVHFKAKVSESIFTNELPKYVQGNLALSTLLLIVLFNENDALFGMNLILTSVVYLFVLFASKRKENHIVFTILFIYGAYMLIENTSLEVFDLALFSSFGFLFIGISRKKNEENIQKLFTYTSAIVSLCSFVFITGKAIFMGNEQSLLLAVSYLLIALNFGYLARVLQKSMFKYSTMLFVTLSGIQVVWQINNVINYEFNPVGYFILGLFIYVTLFVFNKWKYTMEFKLPALLFSILSMVFGLLNLLLFEQWLELILSLLIFAYIAFQLSSNLEKFNRIISTYVSAGSIYLALITIFQLIESGSWYEENISLIGHLTIVALSSVILSFVLRKLNKPELMKAIDISGICLYFYAFSFFIYYIFINDQIVAFYFLIGSFLTARMANIAKVKVFWYVSGILFALSYNLFLLINLDFGFQMGFIYFALCPIILLAVSRLYVKEYFAIAQVNTFLLLVGTIVAHVLFSTHYIFVLLIIALIFIYSFNSVEKVALKTVYLYVSLAMLPIIGYFMTEKYNLSEIYFSTPVLFFISSLIYLVIRFYMKNWKDQTSYYTIFFSIFGLILFILPGHETAFEIVIMFIYIALTVFITTKTKSANLALIPLLVIISFVDKLSALLNFSITNTIIIYAFLVFTMTLIGQRLYRKILSKRSIDVFTLIAFVYLMIMFAFVDLYEVHMLIELIPNLLLVYYFYLQINRLEGLPKKIAKTITAISVLFPYYKVVSYISIPDLLTMEVIVLPWIILLIFLSKSTWENKEKEMNILQWIGLIITAGLIVQDALASNTIYDAFLIGVLSLSAIIYGFSNRLKSYFLTGSVVLLLTILIQSKPFWGNMPWWVYLIAAGSLLIGFGSYHEWKKQNGDTKVEPKWKTLWKSWK